MMSQMIFLDQENLLQHPFGKEMKEEEDDNI